MLRLAIKPATFRLLVWCYGHYTTKPHLSRPYLLINISQKMQVTCMISTWLGRWSIGQETCWEFPSQSRQKTCRSKP